MNITNLSTIEKVELLKQLIDNLDITLYAHYGAEGYITSTDITLKGEEVSINTDICTG